MMSEENANPPPGGGEHVKPNVVVRNDDVVPLEQEGGQPAQMEGVGGPGALEQNLQGQEPPQGDGNDDPNQIGQVDANVEVETGAKRKVRKPAKIPERLYLAPFKLDCIYKSRGFQAAAESRKGNNHNNLRILQYFHSQFFVKDNTYFVDTLLKTPEQINGELEKFGLQGWRIRAHEDKNIAAIAILYRASRVAGEYNEAHRRYCRDNYTNEEAGTQISVFQRTQFNPDYDYVKSGNQITDRLCLCYVNFAKIIGEPLEGAGSKLVHFLRVVKFQKLLATTAEEILRRQQIMS